MTWGMKASQLGYDVTTAADYQLLYSSEWPLLKIEAQGTVTITNLAADQVLYTHNLGYVPMFWIFDTSGGSGGLDGNLDTYAFGPGFGANSTNLKYFGDGFTAGTRTIRYYIFRLDLDTSFTAPTINLSPGSQTIVDGYGIKVAGPGKDVSSTDYRDFVVHTNTRSPMVHMVESKVLSTSSPSDPFFSAPAYKGTWTHNLGYSPLYFAFLKDYAASGYYTPLVPGNGNHGITRDSNSLVVHTSLTNQRVSVVLFKDQLLI